MASMHISLPDNLKAWAESKIEAGTYDTASDYVRDLMRRDQARVSAIAEIQALIDEGLRSGVSSRTFSQIMADARATADAAEQE